MLTAFQCEVTAYLGDGDIYCPECWTGDDCESCTNGERVEHCDAAMIRFTVDEFDTSMSSDGLGDGHEECACTLGVYCGSCGSEISEPFYDDYEHQA